MDLVVFLVVLASAAMQAAWNVILKIRLEPLAALVLVAFGAGAAALPFALWLGPPDPAVMPWIGASMVGHLSYYAFLIGAYSRADLGIAYPVSRGSALLLTALFSILVLHEPIGLVGVAGIVVLAAAILTMSREALGHMMEGRALLLALASGIAVTAFTVIDGTAARIAGSANAYTTWLFVCDAAAIAVLMLLWKGPRQLAPMLAFVPLGFLGGAMLFVSYWLSVWAMTQAPIGLVTAVRESSVLFGAIMSVAILREPLRTDRILAACMVIGGLVLIKLH